MNQRIILSIRVRVGKRQCPSLIASCTESWNCLLDSCRWYRKHMTRKVCFIGLCPKGTKLSDTQRWALRGHNFSCFKYQRLGMKQCCGSGFSLFAKYKSMYLYFCAKYNLIFSSTFMKRSWRILKYFWENIFLIIVLFFEDQIWLPLVPLTQFSCSWINLIILFMLWSNQLLLQDIY